MRKIDYSFAEGNVQEEQSILQLANDFVSFLQNFENIQSVNLMTLNDPKYVKSRFFLDHLKPKCDSLIAKSEDDEKDKIKLRILVLEREADLSTPAMMDLHYEVLLSDVLNIDFGSAVDGETAKVRYDESSKLYEKYRYTFINQVMDRMQNELKEFKKKYHHLIDKNAEIDSGNVNNALMSVGQHNKELSDIKLHIKHTAALDQWTNKFDIIGNSYKKFPRD